nr:MAG TPA: hypothetical protein [Caudoviricetes sp.]
MNSTLKPIVKIPSKIYSYTYSHFVVPLQLL